MLRRTLCCSLQRSSPSPFRTAPTLVRSLFVTHTSQPKGAEEVLLNLVQEVSLKKYPVRTKLRGAWIDRALANARLLAKQGIPSVDIQHIYASKAAVHLGRISTLELHAFIDYLRSLGIHGTQVAVVLSKTHHTRYLDVDRALKPKVETLQNIGLDGEHLKKFILRDALHLRGDISNLREILAILESLPLDKPTLCRILTFFPPVLDFNIEQTLKPKLDILRGSLGNYLHLALYLRPRLLRFSVDALQKKMALLEEFGIERSSKCFARAFSIVVSLNCEKIRAKFNFLMSLGFSKDDVCKIVKRASAVFGLKEEVTLEKVAFLTKVMNRPLSDIVHWPEYLHYNIARRIRPRYETYTVWKAQNSASDHALPYIFSCADKVFDKRFKVEGCEV